MSIFIENESNAHKCAKNVLIEWIKPYIEWNGDGVFAEYPLVDRSKKCSNFCDVVIGFNYATGEEVYYGTEVPSYKQCIEYNEYPIAVLDIAVVQKGLVRYGFEICHKNPVSIDKRNKLRKHFSNKGLTIYEISAKSILDSVGKLQNISNHLTLVLNGGNIGVNDINRLFDLPLKCEMCGESDFKDNLCVDCYCGYCKKLNDDCTCCNACGGSGTCYWSDDIDGICMECCCIDCGKSDLKCNFQCTCEHTSDCAT